jgi:hypothetical protein
MLKTSRFRFNSPMPVLRLTTSLALRPSVPLDLYGAAEEAGKNGDKQTNRRERHPSGAKALVDLAELTARLKSCPVTKRMA